MWLQSLQKNISQLRLLGLSEEAIMKRLAQRADKELKNKLATSTSKEFWAMVKLSIKKKGL